MKWKCSFIGLTNGTLHFVGLETASYSENFVSYEGDLLTDAHLMLKQQMSIEEALELRYNCFALTKENIKPVSCDNYIKGTCKYRGWTLTAILKVNKR